MPAFVVALAAAPPSLNVTDPIVSPFCSPELENAAVPNDSVVLYVLVWLFAVIVSAAAVTVLETVATFTEVAPLLLHTTLPE